MKHRHSIITQKHIVFLGLGLLTILATIFLLHFRQKPSADAPIKAAQSNLAPVHGLESPALLPNALIWHPANSNTLVFQPLDERPSITYGWIIGIPQQWAIHPSAASNSYHLLWRNTAGELWRSQINLDGEQSLSPLLISNKAVKNFATLSLSSGQTLILWQSQADYRSPLSLLVIDQWSRPLFQQDNFIPDAQFFAATTDSAGQTHLIWTSFLNDSHYPLYHATLERAEAALILKQTQLYSIESPPTAWLDSLHFFSDGNSLSALWGMTDIASPDHSTFAGITWTNPAELSPFTLSLPDYPDARFRWIGTVQSAAPLSNKPIVLTAALTDTWQALLLYLDNGQLSSYQLLSEQVANASAPTVWIDANQQISAAWHAINPSGQLQVYTSQVSASIAP